VRYHSHRVMAARNFFPERKAFRGRRIHQVRLEGGDAFSDSYCYS